MKRPSLLIVPFLFALISWCRSGGIRTNTEATDQRGHRQFDQAGSRSWPNR